MAKSYQTTTADGGTAVPQLAEVLVGQINAGALLPSDRVRGEGGLVRVDEVPQFSQAINGLDAQLQSGTVADLIKELITISANRSSGRLVLKREKQWESVVFVDGKLVGSGPEVSPASSVEARQARALAAVKSILAAFRWPEIRRVFVSGESETGYSAVASIDVRTVVEMGFGSICPDEMLRERTLSMGALGPATSASAIPSPPFDQTDLALVARIEGVPLTTGVLAQASAELGIDERQICLRLSLLKLAGFLGNVTPKADKQVSPVNRASERPTGIGSSADASSLRNSLVQLKGKNLFDQLGVRRGVDAEGAALALEARRVALETKPNDADDPTCRQLRADLDALLVAACETLSDPVVKGAYNRSLQTGQNFADPAARKALIAEQGLLYARSQMSAQNYEVAESVLEGIVSTGTRDAQVHIAYGWSIYLASDGTAEETERAAQAVRRGLEIDGNSDEAFLTLGKIYRLSGNIDEAKKNLAKATQLNPENGEAWAQRRLLNTKRSGAGGLDLSLELGQGVTAVVVMALLVIGMMYVAANVIPGGPAEWPRVGAGAEVSMGGAMDAESKLAAQVRERLQGEVDYAIPKDKQFLGSVESYYLLDDSWFWLRRILLLVLGILGILFVSKEGLKDIAVFGEKGGLVFAAIPYGIVVGFLSPIPLTPTPLGPALGMATLHVIAEQVFFFVFVGRALLKDAENPAMNAGLAALLFGLYQLSFYSVSQAHLGVMLLGVVQMTAFAGGAYALLLWRSGGILAPMTAHLVINAVMIIRAVTQHSA